MLSLCGEGRHVQQVCHPAAVPASPDLHGKHLAFQPASAMSARLQIVDQPEEGQVCNDRCRTEHEKHSYTELCAIGTAIPLKFQKPDLPRSSAIQLHARHEQARIWQIVKAQDVYFTCSLCLQNMQSSVLIDTGSLREGIEVIQDPHPDV